MRRLVATLALTTAAATIVPALPAAPANAQQYVHQDARHDVLDEEDAYPVPRNRQGDIRMVRFQHRVHDVRIVIEARAARGGVREWTVGFRAGKASRNGRVFDLKVDATDPDTTGTVTFTRGRRLHKAQCDGVRTRILSKAATIVIVVPRSCLKDPQWVRMDVSLTWCCPECGWGVFDYALENGDDDDFAPSRRSPKIYRGSARHG